MSSNLDKDKQKEEEEKRKRKEKKESQKRTEEENLKKINLQQSEKIRLNYVFNQLCELENEKSSDDDSKSKKYLQNINKKAKEKQMKFTKGVIKSKLGKMNKKNYKNKDDEDEDEKGKKEPKKKFSQKALRKVIRKFCNEFAKDELDNMIWEVDENLDGYISEDEFENMYKKCITDENEEEGKKLFYLTQFLMYDKDEKHEICVEDTLEILCARHQNNVDQALDAIFDIEKIDENENNNENKKLRYNKSLGRGNKETLSSLLRRKSDLSLDKKEKNVNMKTEINNQMVENNPKTFNIKNLKFGDNKSNTITDNNIKIIQLDSAKVDKTTNFNTINEHKLKKSLSEPHNLQNSYKKTPIFEKKISNIETIKEENDIKNNSPQKRLQNVNGYKLRELTIQNEGGMRHKSKRICV